MKIIKYLLIVFLSFSLSASAQNKVAENTLLWEVFGNGLSKPSYLFGTYHLIGKEFTDTMKVVNEKLKAANAIVGEILTNDSSANILSRHIIMKNNTLDKLLSKEEYKIVADFFKAKAPDLDMKSINTYKPTMIAMVVTLLNSAEIDMAEKSMDDSFQIYAKENNKKVIGLETVDFQGELLFDDDLEKQKKALLKAIKEIDKNKQAVKDVYQYYITQDMEKLDLLFAKEEEESKEFMNELLKNRNNRWLDQLPTLMQKNSLFIAVGAGHLVGKDGLIKGLREKGYTVKPLATN